MARKTSRKPLIISEIEFHGRIISVQQLQRILVDPHDREDVRFEMDLTVHDLEVGRTYRLPGGHQMYTDKKGVVHVYKLPEGM